MAQGGLFRSAMRGFHKQDVLQYIDEITGAWDAERKELEQQAAAALAAEEQLKATTQQAVEEAQQAKEQTKVAEDRLQEVLIRMAELEAQLADAQEANQQQREQIDTLQQSLARYENAAGNAGTAQAQVDDIVRPFIEQANKQADETLDNVQAVLAGVLAQLGELQGNVEQRRQALYRCKADSDSRLSAAFGDWLEETKQATSTDHFFR